MADSPPKNPQRKSRYTEGRGIAGAFEGETVTRRRLMEGGALAVGGVATMAFGLPALGFALGPVFEDTSRETWQDVGAERDFNETSYVPRVISITPSIGEAGKTTIYVRKAKSSDVSPSDKEQHIKPLPYVAMSTRCAHLGCPVRWQVTEGEGEFRCPCHGGVYNINGDYLSGPPPRGMYSYVYEVRDDGNLYVRHEFDVGNGLNEQQPYVI